MTRGVTRGCITCGDSFTRPPSQAHVRFCSAECWHDFARTHAATYKPAVLLNTNCKECGGYFKFRRQGAVRRIFCSEPCMLKWRANNPSPRRKERVSHVCNWCGSGFKKLACQSLGIRGRFCSKSCRAASSASGQGKLKASAPEKRFLDSCANLGIVLARQVRFGPYCVDGFSQDRRVAVEFDGEYWHSLPRAKERDSRKNKYLQDLGITVVRISEKLYHEHPERAIQLVREAVA